MTKKLLTIAFFAPLLFLTIPTATGQLESFEVELMSYEEDEVIPGSSFNLEVRVYKPADVWIVSGKIYAYIYDYVDNQRLVYNAGGEKSVASAEAYFYELKWGTFSAVEENFLWALPVAENAPIGEDLRLKISMNLDLSDLKVKIGDNVYTGDNLENWLVGRYPEDPVGSGWHVIRDRHSPTSITVQVENFVPPLTSPYLNIAHTRYDVLVHRRAQNPYFWIFVIETVVIVVLLVIIVKIRRAPPKEIEIEITR